MIKNIKQQLESATQHKEDAKKAREEAETLDTLKSKYGGKKQEEKVKPEVEVPKTKIDIEADEEVKKAEKAADEKVKDAEKAAEKEIERADEKIKEAEKDASDAKK